MMSFFRPLIRRFARSQNGHAAVEFSFIAPVCLTILFGAMEVTDGVTTNKYVEHATAMIADLTARTPIEGGEVKIYEDELEDIFRAATQILNGHGIEGARMRITSLERNASDDGYEVVWSQEVLPGSSVMTTTVDADYAAGSAFTNLGPNQILDTDIGLMDPGHHLILAEIEHEFTSKLSSIKYSNLKLKGTQIRLPRSDLQIHFCTEGDECTND